VHCPPGLDVRPTSSKVRQAFFNILGTRVVGATFLDLFAGSGLMGFEALSRGAAYVAFVEESRLQGRAIEQSIQMFGDEAGEAQLILGDFRLVLEHLKHESKFDLIFADPPYKKQYGSTVLGLVERLSLLGEGGLMIIEHFRDDPLPDNSPDGNLVKSDYRLYGQTALTFFSSK
jgi:16S rRNA (guanine966-N2)-methyltransferase